MHAKLSVSQILHNVTVLFMFAYTMLLPGGCRARCHVAFAIAVFCQCILQTERSFVLHGLLHGRKLDLPACEASLGAAQLLFITCVIEANHSEPEEAVYSIRKLCILYFSILQLRHACRRS